VQRGTAMLIEASVDNGRDRHVEAVQVGLA
jgi:hypothetical protein